MGNCHHVGPFGRGCILLSIGKEGQFQNKAGTSTHTGTRVQAVILVLAPSSLQSYHGVIEDPALGEATNQTFQNPSTVCFSVFKIYI